MKRQFTVEEEGMGLRIDRYLSERCGDLSRSHVQKLLKEGAVLAGGVPVKSSYQVRAGEVLEFELKEPVEAEIVPEEMALDILYEDQDIILVNKPKGMVVHPAPGHYSQTLVNGLMAHCRNDLSGINGSLRPGIVHRIDRDTTGVLIACKNDLAHHSIAAQLKEHSITRRYVAICCGTPKPEEGTIETSIGRHPTDRKKMSIHARNGRNAITHYKVLEHLKGFSYVECSLETGRTHQIRVHMASVGHPLLGDLLYGPAKCPFSLSGQTLHAKVLGIVHPRSGEYMEFHAPLPAYFEELLEKLRYS